MESTWLILVSLLLAAHLLATVLTEGAPTPTTVVTQEPITIPFVKVRYIIRQQSTCVYHVDTLFHEQRRGTSL